MHFQAGAARKSNSRSFLITGSLVATIICFEGCDRSHPTIRSTATVTVAKPVQKQTVDLTVYDANLVAVKKVEIRSRATGYLDNVTFHEGSFVKTGDLLFVIDPRPYEAALDRAAAIVQEEKAKLALANSSFQKTEDAFQKTTSTVTSEQYQEALANRDEANATLMAAEANRELDKLNVYATQISSPIDGWTSAYAVSIGSLVEANTVLTTVVSINPIYAYFYVDEASVLEYEEAVKSGRISLPEEGQTHVWLQLANELGFTHAGVVDFSDNEVDAKRHEIRVRAVFANTDNIMRPGMSGHVQWPNSSEYNVLLIADRAVISDRGLDYVYVFKDGSALMRRIILGDEVDGLRVVRSGLESSDLVIVDGINRITEGIVLQGTVGRMEDYASVIVLHER